jgi:lysophospholipase L1-like esterase
MSSPSASLKFLKIVLFIALGIQILIALLFFGKYPLIFRWGIYAQAPADRQGMRLRVYGSLDRSGPSEIRFTPGAFYQLDNSNTSLGGYGIWQVKKAGTYILFFHCDDYGELFLDGHHLISLKGISADNTGQAVINLPVGPHFLVVYLFNEPQKGHFRLEVQGPGEKAPGSSFLVDLHPWNPPGKARSYWEAANLMLSWIRSILFWITLAFLFLVTLAIWKSKTFKQALGNVILILGSCFIAAVLGEVAARLFFPPPPKVSFRETALPGQRTDQREGTFVIPTERGYRNAPLRELVIEHHPWSPNIPLVFKTNSLGYRNPEIGPKQGKRLLFLGDSITFGHGVNEEWTFVRLLQNLARAQGENWETVNGAVEGLGTNGELAVLEETGLALQPDVVVLDFYLNDFLESPGIFMTRLPGLLDRSRLAHQLENLFTSTMFISTSEKNISVIQPMQKPPDEIFAWRDEFKKKSTVLPLRQKPDPTTQAFQEAVLQNFEDWGGAFSPRVWKDLELLLDEFARLAKEHRFRFVLVAFPVRAQVETAPLFDYPQQRLSQIARNLKVPCFDLLPLFRTDFEKNKKEEDRLFLDHCHLTARGNRVTAQAIYRFLKQTPFPEGN